MADSSIPLDEPANADSRLDAESITGHPDAGGLPVRRERVVIGGAALAEIAKVTNAAPGASDYGIVTRPLAPVAGAGAVTALTPRQTLASDDPAVTALQIIDDWDESDRAKVNPIAGQAGVAAGAGVTGASTQRVVLANDDAVIGATNETAPASDTAASGLNGRLQRIAQRLTTLLTALFDNLNVAHDGVDAGNPLKVGAKALDFGAGPTPVAAGDRTHLYANRHGIPWVLGGHPGIITVEAAYTAAQTDTAIVTVGAGTKIVVTMFAARLDEATTVGVGYRAGFGAVNTPTTTGVVASHPGLVPGSGDNWGDGSGIVGVGADGEDLRITSEVPTGGSLRVIAKYFPIEG